VDTSERIINLNHAAARLFGVDAREAVGRSVQEVVRNSDLHRLVSETLSSDKPVEGTLELTGGVRERQLQVHGTTLQDEKGRSIGAVIVLNDITRLRRLENVRREFVANVSHELRTPITSIKGFLETLVEGAVDKPEDARRFLDIMVRHADQLNNIIEDLLALARIEQGTEEGGIELSRQQVGRVLKSAVQTVEQRAAAKGVTIRFEGDLDITADLNPRLLEQAIVNLLVNAITYSPDGGSIEIGSKPSNGGVDIFVRDNGPGIDERHHERIFERFYRVDRARSRSQGGTGLGLAIVKHIALAHAGSVRVDSKPGAGSTFTLSLPHRYTEH
jgi:two-component system phosphate regulon sensor histidine kinase PhoR